MASSAELKVGVKVELEVGERTAEWLESMGWIRPDAPSEESVVSELDDVEEDFDPRPLDLVGVDFTTSMDSVPVKIPMDRDQPCEHTEPGSSCDWNVFVLPVVECRDPFVKHDGESVTCNRAKSHPGIHSTGIKGDQWPQDAVNKDRPRAMGGSEAMRLRAACLRRDIMGALRHPEAVDEMLRMLDIDPAKLPKPTCDC